jgi:hypothetical protein
MGRITKRGFENISAKVGNAGGALRDELRAALQESLEEGRDEMQRRIQISGTGKTWVANWDDWKNATAGRRGSTPGRVAKGHMRDSVTYSMSGDTKYRVRGRVGWTGRLGDDRYFIAQDQGFKHAITGQKVKGMLILRDIGKFVDDRFERRARVVAQRIARLDF